MNLDINNGGRHFGSRFPSLFFRDSNSFPPFLLRFPALASGSSGILTLLTRSSHYETYGHTIPPPAQEAFPEVSSFLAAYVALNPVQFAQLQAGKIWLEDRPDQSSGTRPLLHVVGSTPGQCSRSCPHEEIHDLQNSFHEHRLQKGDGHDAFRSGYYRWHGPLYRRKRGKDQHNVEHMLCWIEDEYIEII